MKKIFAVIVLLMSVCTAHAAIPHQAKMNSLPEGTFKKTRSGKIIQYNPQGKKIGVYKFNSGRYVKVK